MNNRFNSKIAIITGGADGIGKAIAHRLGREGATIALFDINPTLLNETVTEFEKSGIMTKGYVIDISDENHVSAAVEKVENSWKKIDILVHAAGIVGPTSTKITDFPTSDFDEVIMINLKGTFLITKYTLKVMEKKGSGRILLISSIAGKEGNPGMVGYSCCQSWSNWFSQGCS